MDDEPLPQDPPKPPEPRDLAPDAAPAAANLDAILSIPVTVQVVLGSTSLPVASS